MAPKRLPLLRPRDRARVKALRTSLRSERLGEFGMTTAGLDAIRANLLTSQAGIRTRLTSGNRRTLNRMSALADRTAARTAGDLGKGAREAASLFGSAQGTTIDNGLRVARAGRRAAIGVAGADVAAGKRLSKAGDTALGIQSSAASEAAAGADFALANALQYRARDDAALVADRQNMFIQAGLQRRQTAYEHRLAEKESSAAGGKYTLAASDQLMSLAQSGATKDEVDATARALALQYNLGPAATERLTAVVDTLYGPDGQNLVNQTRDSLGNPIKTEPDDADYTAMKSTAVSAVTAGPDGKPMPAADAWSAVLATFTDKDGKLTVSDAYLQKLQDAFNKYYEAAIAAYNEVSKAFTLDPLLAGAVPSGSAPAAPTPSATGVGPGRGITTG